MQLLWAALQPDGWSVLVAFDDRPTNRAGMAELVRGPCSMVLTDATVALIRGGSAAGQPRCTWLTPSMLRVLLPSRTQLVVGSVLELRNATVFPRMIGNHSMTSCIGPSDGLSTCASGAVTVGSPSAESVVPPVARISGATTLSVCSDSLSLSALSSSGGGAFPLSYEWHASISLPSLAAHLGAYPAAASHVTVPAELIPANVSVRISLRVAAVDLGSSSALVGVDVFKAAGPTLMTGWEGGANERRVRRTESTSIFSSVSLPSTECWGNNQSEPSLQVRYVWRIEAANASADLLAAISVFTASAEGSRELRIPRDTLLAGSSYVVHVTATATSVGATAMSVGGSSAVLALHVDHSPLHCLVHGGSRRSVGARDALLLQADASDPDYPATPLPIVWSCVDERAEQAADLAVGETGVLPMAHAPCHTAGCIVDGFSASSCHIVPLNRTGASVGRLTFEPGTLPAGALYRFTATVSKDGREASSSSTLDVVGGSLPAIQLSARSPTNAPLIAVGNELVFDSSQKLILDAATPSDMPSAPIFAWTVRGGLAISGTTSEPSLALMPGTVQAGRRYTFELSVSTLGAAGDASHSAAHLVVRGAEPPSSGEVEATPPRGELLTDVFSLVQRGWFVEESRLPLRYLFESHVASSSSIEQATTSTLSVCQEEPGIEWRVLSGPQDVPTHVEPLLPAGNITIRAVAIDVLGIRGCALTSVEVNPPSAECGGACFQGLAASVLVATFAASEGGYAERPAHTVGFLADLLNMGASNDVSPTGFNANGSGANQTSSDEAVRLAERMAMREGLVAVLEASQPSADDSPTLKAQTAASLSSVLSAPRELTGVATARASQLIDTIVIGLQPADGDASLSLYEPLLRSIGSLLEANRLAVPRHPPAPPEPPALPNPPDPPPQWADEDSGSEAVSGAGRRRLLGDAAPPSQPPVAPSDPRAASANLVQCKVNAYRIAAHVGQQLVAGESPAAVAPGSVHGVALGVVKTRADSHSITVRAPMHAQAHLGNQAVAAVIERAQLSAADVLQVEIVDFPTALAEPVEPFEPGMPTPRIASAVVSMRFKANGVGVPLVITTATGGEPAASLDEAVAAALNDTTSVTLPRQNRRGTCSRDYHCRGPLGVTVDGRCSSGRCECPLPWAGIGCKAISRCVWWANDNGTVGRSWSYERCTLSVTASTDQTAVCTCTIAGSFDVAVVEGSGRTIDALINFNVEFGNWNDVMRDVASNPTIAILVLSVKVLWLIAVVISKCRGNESERRKHKEFFDFWTAQHKHRIAGGKKASFLKRLKGQLRGQHKLYRIFFHHYELGEDPAKIPTGAQKATVLAILIQFKMLACALLWGQAQKPDDTSFTILQRVAVGCSAAFFTLPASVFLDQLFFRAQRVTNSSPSASCKEANITLIARSAMHVAINNLGAQTALLAWKTAVEEVKVTELQETLLARREAALALSDAAAHTGVGHVETWTSANSHDVMSGTSTRSGSSTVDEGPTCSTLARPGAQEQWSRKLRGRWMGLRGFAWGTTLRIAPTPVTEQMASETERHERSLTVHGDGSISVTNTMTLQQTTTVRYDARSSVGLLEEEAATTAEPSSLPVVGASVSPTATLGRQKKRRRGSVQEAVFADVRAAAGLFTHWRMLPADLIARLAVARLSFQENGSPREVGAWVACDAMGEAANDTDESQQPPTPRVLLRATSLTASWASYSTRTGHGPVSAPPMTSLPAEQAPSRPPWYCCCVVLCVRLWCCLLCCRPERLQPHWLRWWLMVWYSNVPFWRVFPWVVTIPMLLGSGFLTLYIAQTIFKDDSVYVLAFLESFGISLAQGWFIQDVIVIAVRNNTRCWPTGKGRVRSYRAQVIEKFYLAPLAVIKSVMKAAIIN